MTNQRKDLVDNLCRELTTEGSPVLFLTGDAGIGKSTTIRAVERLLHSRPEVLVASVDCSVPVAGADVGSVEALLPWVEVMRTLARPSGDVRSMVADLAMAWIKFVPIVGDAIESTVATVKIVKEHRGGHQEPSSREHVFQQCIDFFRSVAEQHPLIILIDDAHWADDSSMNLLFALARQQINDLRILVAYRPHDVRTSRDGNEHSLLRIRRELERYELCREVQLPPLSRAEIEQIASERFGQGACTTELIDRIERFSAGNPLLVQGFDIDENTGTGTVKAVVDEILSRLDRPLKDLLMIAAAEGETFTSPMLSALSTKAPLEVATSLRRAEQEYGIVRSLGKRTVYGTMVSAYEFANDALHDALFAQLGGEESEILHEMIAERLEEERHAIENDALAWISVSSRIAAHRTMSGDAARAAEAWLTVAERAWSIYGEKEALNAVRMALERLDDIGDVRMVQRPRAQAMELTGRIHFFFHRINDAEQAFDQALEGFRSIGDQHLVIMTLCRLASIANVNGDPKVMRQRVDEAQRLAETGTDRQGMLAATSMLGLWYETIGDVASAIEAQQQARQMATEQNDALRLGNALTNLSRLLIRVDRDEESIALAREAVDVFMSHAHWERAARTMNNIGIALANRGEINDAARVYTEALALHERVGDAVGASSLRTNLAQLLYQQDRYDEALALLDRSIAQKEELGERYGLCIAIYSQGVVLAAMGDRVGALSLLQRALALAKELHEQLVVEEVERAIAELNGSSAERQ